MYMPSRPGGGDFGSGSPGRDKRPLWVRTGRSGPADQLSAGEQLRLRTYLSTLSPEVCWGTLGVTEGVAWSAAQQTGLWLPLDVALKLRNLPVEGR
jgi:hypothetical protein